MDISMTKTVDAVRVTSSTLVGVRSDKFPVKGGNCFSMVCSDGHERRILNFALENLNEAIRRGVALPVKVLPLSAYFAVIMDPRIPDDWYNKELCRVCSPSDFLSIPQKIKNELDLAVGRVRVIEFEVDGTKHKMIKRKLNSGPDLRTQDERQQYEEAKLAMEQAWSMAGLAKLRLRPRRQCAIVPAIPPWRARCRTTAWRGRGEMKTESERL
jgi:hypothetical protein